MPAVPFGGVTTATSMAATMLTTMVVLTIMSAINDLSAMLQDGIRYGTIFADPPWPGTGGGQVRALGLLQAPGAAGRTSP